MPRGVRRKEGEDFSKSTIKRVINLLEAEKPITKKAACDILNMSYNTTRLNKIIENYKTEEERIKERKRRLRGKAVEDNEKAFIISNYLNGVSVSDIEDQSGRSNLVVNRVLKEYNIPNRETTKNYEPVFLPDDSIQSSYNKDDLVFSAKYNCMAKVNKECQKDVYSIWLFEPYQQWACQPYWELGSLVKVQKELGVDVETLSGDEIKYLINQALINAKKLKNVQN